MENRGICFTSKDAKMKVKDDKINIRDNEIENKVVEVELTIQSSQYDP